MSEKAEKTEKLDKPHKKKNEKPFEGRRYALWPPKSIITLAEMCGLSGLNEDIASKLGEDVSYRLREIIHNCNLHIRHMNEKKLTTAIVSKVLPGSSELSIYGYGCDSSAELTHIPTADLFIPENTVTEVNLVDMALDNEVYEQKGNLSVKGIWYLPDQVSESSATPDVPPESSATPPLIPPDLELYYNSFAKAILCSNDKVFKVVLLDLKTNSLIGLVVPWFINLVVVGLAELPRHSVACERLLWIVQSLILNEDVFPDAVSSVKKLLTALLVFAVDPRVPDSFPLSEDLELRTTASVTLAMIVQNWYGSEDALIKIVAERLNTVLFDSSNTLRSHCGALSVLYALGPEAPGYWLWPNLEQYFQFLSLLNIEPETVELFGDILMVAEFLYLPDWELAEDSPEDIALALSRIAEIDRVLYEFFGDALCAYRRQSFMQAISVRSVKCSEYGVQESEEELSESFGIPKVSGSLRQVVRGVACKSNSRIVNCPTKPLKRQKRDVQQIDLNQVFELPVRRREAFIQIGSVAGMALWSRALQQRRLDPSQQYCEMSSPYVQKCNARLDFIGKRILNPERKENVSVDLTILL